MRNIRILWPNGWCDGNYVDNSLAAKAEDHYNTGSWFCWRHGEFRCGAGLFKAWNAEDLHEEKFEWQSQCFCEAQGGGRTSIAVLGFFCSFEAMPMHMIFQGRGAYQVKKASEHRILCAVRVRQGGGVETVNQLKDVTLTVRRGGGWTRLRWWEWRGTENRPWWEHPSSQLNVACSWSSAVPVTGWHHPPFSVLTVSNCIHHSHCSLLKDFFLWAVFLLLLYFLSRSCN